VAGLRIELGGFVRKSGGVVCLVNFLGFDLDSASCGSDSNYH